MMVYWRGLTLQTSCLILKRLRLKSEAHPRFILFLFLQKTFLFYTYIALYRLPRTKQWLFPSGPTLGADFDATKNKSVMISQIKGQPLIEAAFTFIFFNYFKHLYKILSTEKKDI